MSDSTTRVPQSDKDAFDWIAIIKDSFASLSGNAAKVIVKSVNMGVKIAIESVDGKSWDQIAGKLLGTALDTLIVSRLKVENLGKYCLNHKLEVYCPKIL